MSPRRHLDDLFSAAYEDELAPIEEARFQAHMQSCAPCAEAYAELRSSIETLRELSRARMPHVVHLPSTATVAERPVRPRSGLSWFNLGLVRRFPATAIAAVAAVVLVIAALAHGTGAPSPIAAGANSDAHAPAVGVATPVAELSCVHSIVDIKGATPPSDFGQEARSTDPAQPALHLVLAAPTLVVTPGRSAVVYAQLSVPVATISNPGTPVTSVPPRAVLPCVSIAVGSTSQLLTVVPDGLTFQIPEAQGAGSRSGLSVPEPGGVAGPIFSFQVPAGLARGTEIHVMATIPAGYTSLASPPLIAELTLTTG